MHPAAEIRTQVSASARQEPFGKEPFVIAFCCLAIILALVLGVGLASNLVLRHIVQTVPLWLGVALGFRCSRATGWVALPSFLFWLVLMVCIWLYVLGIARIITGHFSPVEIAMTIIVGLASLIGVAMFARLKWPSPATKRFATFLGLLLLQMEFFRLSFLPAIAHR